MKSEEIIDRATEQLAAALKAGHSEALTGYLRAIEPYCWPSPRLCAIGRRRFVPSLGRDEPS
jgi:hypothetical protein